MPAKLVGDVWIIKMEVMEYYSSMQLAMVLGCSLSKARNMIISHDIDVIEVGKRGSLKATHEGVLAKLQEMREEENKPKPTPKPKPKKKPPKMPEVTPELKEYMKRELVDYADLGS